MRCASLCELRSAVLGLFLRSTLNLKVNLAIGIALVCFGSAQLQAQSNEWTWVSGSSTVPANGSAFPPIYGSLGVPAAGNTPGSRSAAVSWTDTTGNFWIFGGTGTQLSSNDLWRYNSSTGEWAWISGSMASDVGGDPVYGTLGVPAPGNVPGARSYAAGWTDKNGNLWLFGGDGITGGTGAATTESGLLNDLWEFNPNTKQWAWMAGSSTAGSSCGVGGPYIQCGRVGVYGTEGVVAQGNTPGSRQFPIAWTDASGNLWLFGGYGYDSLGRWGYLNDLWKFDVSVNQWAWMGGPNTLSNCLSSSFGACVEWGQPGVYGTLGISSSSDSPGGRFSPITWADASGNLWIFGGAGVDEASFKGDLSDLWEFDVSSGQWTWVSGNSTAVRTSTYGTLGVPNAGNYPPGRSAGVGWVDTAGNLWMFGGAGYDAAGDSGSFNDLWVFNSSNHEWAWMGGQSTFGYCLNPANPPDSSSSFGCGQTGVYGTQGTSAVGNLPGSRSDLASWVDGGGNFWLFGGGGFASTNAPYTLDDLWEYQPSANSLPPAITPVFAPIAETYTSAQTVAISNGMGNATIYYTTDGTTPTTSSKVYSSPITVSSTETLEALATATGYPTSGVAVATYTITPLAATPTFSPAAGTYGSPQTVTISDTTAGATIYYTTDSTTPTTSSPVYSAPISVSTSQTIEAIAVAAGYAPSSVATAAYSLPVTFQLSASPSSVSLKAGGQATLTLTVTPQNGFNSAVSFACSGLPSGASCSFNPSTVTPPNTTSTTLTVTAPPSQTAALRHNTSAIPGGMLVVALWVFGWKKRRSLRLLLVFLSLAAGLNLVTACSSSPDPPPPATSTVTVRASSGSVAQMTTFSMTVN